MNRAALWPGCGAPAAAKRMAPGRFRRCCWTTCGRRRRPGTLTGKGAVLGERGARPGGERGSPRMGQKVACSVRRMISSCSATERSRSSAVARHPDDEVPVPAQVWPWFAQLGGGDHVELHVVAIQLEVGAHQAVEVVDAALAFQQAGRELHVQQGAAGLHMIHLRGGPEHSGGTLAVGALHRADAFGEGLAPRRPSGEARHTWPK